MLNKISLKILFIGLFILIASPNTRAEYYPENEQVIKHPGKLDLIYMGYHLREPPLSHLRKVKAHYKYFYVLPGVVTPSIQSVYLLEHTTIKEGEEVLDIGSGSGIQAIFAAEKAKRVVATDLSHAAAENTRFNAKGHSLSHKIDSRQGDLFSAISPKEKFDVIIFNIDYPYDSKTQGLWKVHERFFREVKTYMKPNARIYYQAGLISNIPKIYSMVHNNQLRIMRMDMANALIHNREPIVFLIVRDPLQPDIPM